MAPSGRWKTPPPAGCSRSRPSNKSYRMSGRRRQTPPASLLPKTGSIPVALVMTPAAIMVVMTAGIAVVIRAAVIVEAVAIGAAMVIVIAIVEAIAVCVAVIIGI